MLREIIQKKDFARRIPGVPEFKPSENPWRAQMDLLAEEIGAACGYPLTAANNSEDGGLFIVEYRSSSGQSALSVRVNESGKLCAVLLSSQEEPEFLAIKDAVLSRESIPVDERVRTSLLGDCPYQNLDFPGGYAYVNRVASFVFGLDFDG